MKLCSLFVFPAMLIGGAAFVAVAVSPLAARAQETSAAAPGPTHIGVVNVGQVFNSMQETKDLQARFGAERENLQQLGSQHQQELNTLQQNLMNGPKPGSPQYDEEQETLDSKTVQYENELKMKQLESSRNQARQLRELFGKIDSAVAEVAKKRGLDLVLSELKPDMGAPNLTPDEIAQIFRQQNVLFVDSKLDITAEVVTTLDARYKAGEK